MSDLYYNNAQTFEKTDTFGSKSVYIRNRVYQAANPSGVQTWYFEVYVRSVGAVSYTFTAKNIYLSTSLQRDLLYDIRYTVNAGSMQSIAYPLLYNANNNEWYRTEKPYGSTYTAVATEQFLFHTGVQPFASGHNEDILLDRLSVIYKPASSGLSCMISKIPLMYFTDHETDVGWLNALSAAPVIENITITEPEYDLFSWVIQPVGKFFEIEIMPGVSLGIICGTGVGICLALVFLKMYAGG